MASVQEVCSAVNVFAGAIARSTVIIYHSDTLVYFCQYYFLKIIYIVVYYTTIYSLVSVDFTLSNLYYKYS